jgi:hypothetical protein
MVIEEEVGGNAQASGSGWMVDSRRSLFLS